MDLTEFRGSLQAAEPPQLTLPLQALWWDAKGDWQRAHTCAQADPGADAAAVHAYLHRKEGDDSNAAYWYSRAGRRASQLSLQEEWEEIAGSLLQS